MNPDIFSPLFQNASMLLFLSVVFEAVNVISYKVRRYRSVINGLLIAGICIAIMSQPYTLKPGLVFDTRSILISVTALIFGPVPAIITAAAAAIFRLSAGGIGAWPGVAVITSCMLIGLSWRRWLYPKSVKTRWVNVYLMSITVHVAMLACMLLLPYPHNIETIQTITMPVLVIYPITSTLLSLLLMRQMDTKQLQEQLEQSEERFRALFEQAPLGYQSLDATGKITDVNQKWLDLLGYTKAEVIGMPLSAFVEPNSLEHYYQRFDAFIANGAIDCEMSLLAKTGKPLTIHFEGKIHYGKAGNILHAHCILQDITAQKKALEQQRASEEKYRHLFETMSQGAIYQGPGGELLSANPAAERILGLMADDFKGSDSFSPEWKTVMEDGSAMTEGEHPSSIAMRTGERVGPFVIGVYRPGLKDYVWLSVVVTPMFRQGETKPYQTYALFQDITAERKARQDYQQLFQKMQDGFAVMEILCDEQGKPADYRFLAANPAFEKLSEMKAEDIIGKTILEVAPAVEKFWIDMYGQVALTGEVVQFEHRSANTGNYYSVNAYQTKPMQVACTVIDITQRVLAEKKATDNLHRLQGLLDNFPGPITILDKDGKCICASKYVFDSLSLSKEQVINHKIQEIMPKSVADKILSVLTQAKHSGEALNTVDAFEMNGETNYFDGCFFSIPVAYGQEEIYGYFGMDVTQRILAEEALAKSEKRYASYIKNSPNGIVIIDDTGKIIETNEATGRIAGYSKEEALLMNLSDYGVTKSPERDAELLNALVKNGYANEDFRIRHKNGSILWVNINAVKLSEKRYMCFVSDITEKKVATERLIHASTHDTMTGLANRQQFDREAQRLNVPEQMPLSIILADINGLKLINDSFGSSEGDRVIVQTAEFLRGFCRAGDVLARSGGDEFCILLPKTDFRKAMGILYDIQEACGVYNTQIANASLHISLALGVGTKETVEDDLADARRQAESYLNQRKLLEQRSSHSSILTTIKATMKEKSHETEAHEERMAALARKVGLFMGLSDVELNHMELLAELHDIGKVGISEQILNKSGKLNDEEWEEMKKHPEIGERIAMSSSSLAPIANYVLCHHEQWDGSGYPQRLKGKEILLLSRILSVVDAYDAMTHDRVYRKARSHEKALEEIRQCAGTQFDPGIVKIFCERVFEP